MRNKDHGATFMRSRNLFFLYVKTLVIIIVVLTVSNSYENFHTKIFFIYSLSMKRFEKNNFKKFFNFFNYSQIKRIKCIQEKANWPTNILDHRVENQKTGFQR